MPAPINAVDATCQQHDIEYCKCGVGWGAGVLGGKTSPCSLAADERLVNRLSAIKRTLPLGQRTAANVIKTYIGLHMRSQGHQRGRLGAEEAGGVPGLSGNPLDGQ
jgi:hypothetical protein